jgi:hypothetical protein
LRRLARVGAGSCRSVPERLLALAESGGGARAIRRRVRGVWRRRERASSRAKDGRVRSWPRALLVVWSGHAGRRRRCVLCRPGGGGACSVGWRSTRLEERAIGGARDRRRPRCAPTRRIRRIAEDGVHRAPERSGAEQTEARSRRDRTDGCITGPPAFPPWDMAHVDMAPAIWSLPPATAPFSPAVRVRRTTAFQVEC